MTRMTSADYRKKFLKAVRPRAKRSKYRNNVVVVDGITYHSEKEQRRHEALKLLERAKQISDLKLQVAYELAPAVKLEGESRTKPALRYVADFEYFDVVAGKTITEDVKSPATRDTPIYRAKKHLMKTVHNIDIREV